MSNHGGLGAAQTFTRRSWGKHFTAESYVIVCHLVQRTHAAFVCDRKGDEGSVPIGPHLKAILSWDILVLIPTS